MVFGLDENDIQLILKQYNSHFISYELSPGIYTTKDISEVVYTMGDHEGTLRIEYDDISMKTKFFSKRFGEIAFFITLWCFTPYWDKKLTNAIHVDSPGVYTGDKILNINTKNKINLKCGVIDGSVVSGIREPTFFNFSLDKPSGNKVFCEPETLHFKKAIKLSILNLITFYLEDDNHEEVDLNEETLTFTLQMIKI